MITIGAVCHVFEEADALPGWLEMATRFFDDVRVIHAGPEGELSHDGTIEILERWKVPHQFDTINDGFGPLRTRCARYSPCDWVAVLDADERFVPVSRVMRCEGESPVPPVGQQTLQEYDTPTEGACPWNAENAALNCSQVKVIRGDPVCYGTVLRNLLKENWNAIAFIRRHWNDLAMTIPSQNWRTHPDWQARIIRNVPEVYWEGRLHEKLVGAPSYYEADMIWGPFIEHLHLPFKAMRPDKRRRDIETYREIWRRR